MTRIPTLPGRSRSAALALAALLALGLGCATNPVTGRKEISLVSESQEIAAGRQAKAAVAIEYGLYEHAGWTSRVDSIGQAMARISHRPDLPWEFHVIDDPTVNAFAAPGGFIYVTRGILGYLESEAQLAGVVGHEIGHVTARHYARSASRQQLAGLGLAIGSIVSESIARYGQAVQEGLTLLFLKYSRDQETQADELGVEYSIKAGFDPREMPATYRTLARISASSGARLPAYLSTHPDPSDREVTVRALAEQQVGGRTGLRVNHDAYIRMLDGLVFGDDPRQGYFEGTRFYHPGLRFVMDFPSGWRTQNSKSAVMAADADQKSIMQLAVAPAGDLAPAAYAQKLVADRQVAGADGRAETIHGYAAWAGRVAVTDAQGNPGTLSLVLLRQDANTMFRILGQVAPGSAAENAFFAAARSFQALTDPARLSPTPARIRVVAAPRAGLFAQVVSGLGPQGIDLEATGVLNGRTTDESIAAGTLLKIVSPAKLQ